jgi:hypothetical protein
MKQQRNFFRGGKIRFEKVRTRDVKTFPGKVDVTQRALSRRGINLVMPREL